MKHPVYRGRLSAGDAWSWLLGFAALGAVGCGGAASRDDAPLGRETQALTAGGFVVVTGDDADSPGHCGNSQCGGLYTRLFNEAIAESDSPGSGILAIGVNHDPALVNFNGWNNGGPGAVVTFATTTAQIAAANFEDYDLVYVPSSSNLTGGGITPAQLAALNARQVDIAHFVNVTGGSLLALAETDAVGAWGWLPLPLTMEDDDFYSASPTAALTAISPGTTSENLSHGFFHNVFTGPAGYSGLGVLAVKATGDIRPGNPELVGLPVLLGGKNVILTAEVCNDGIDNDGDGDTDHDDTDCRVCGNGIVDRAGEECDDGNLADGDGCSSECLVENHPPVATAGEDVTGDEGDAIALTGEGFDEDGDALTLVWDYVPDSGVDAGASCSFSAGDAASTDITCTDDGVYVATLTVTDTHGASASSSALVTVSNVDPSLSLTAPATGALYPVGSTVSIVAPFTDPGDNDAQVCAIDWDDGSGVTHYPPASGTCDTSKVLSAAGIYTLNVAVADDDGGTDVESTMVAVYDPNGGFVTGGGFVNSPAGAYVQKPTLSGKANFGFVSKYQRGSTTPTGQMEFQFQAGDFNLHIASYDWLVVAGARAQLKGSATVNGVGGYQFLLTAVDGQVNGGGGADRFRLKVTGPGGLVYDNAPGSDDVDASAAQLLGGGSIVIHK